MGYILDNIIVSGLILLVWSQHGKILGWPESLFRFFFNMENPHELFGQPIE